MSRWINIADAIKIMACEMYAEAQSQGYDVDSVEDFIPEAKAWMNDAPSIDIVRCAECVWRDKDNQGEDYCTYVKGLADINEDSFCSYGEREGE